jgi:hypothetical protein
VPLGRFVRGLLRKPPRAVPRPHHLPPAGATALLSTSGRESFN